MLCSACKQISVFPDPGNSLDAGYRVSEDTCLCSDCIEQFLDDNLSTLRTWITCPDNSEQ